MPDPSYHKRDNFVPANNPPPVQIISPTDPSFVGTGLPPAPISEPYPLSSFRDRSHGFVLATAPLAAATGFVVLLIGILAFGVPILSVAALLLSLAGFTVAWLCAFILHTMVSAEGSLLIHVLSVWAYLRAEQKNRFKRYDKR
jgi:hypothetical protein